MPLSLAADASPSSSFLLSKCGSTLFCLGRSVILWIAVLALFLSGAIRHRLASLARRASEGVKKD